MTYETLNFDVSDKIATITINRPDNGNALNGKMAEELFDISVICGHEDIRAVIVTATGKLFCGGGDLAEMNALADKADAHLTRMATMLHGAIIRFSHMDAPVIMAVNGTAGGGGFSLVLSGDYVLASENAKFISAYTASGLTPDGSSTYHLAKHVGLLRAKELILTNRMLSAEEACDWGMVNKVVASDELMNEANKLAQQFASGPTKALGGAKKMLNTAFSASMENQLELETRMIASMMNTHDGPHGIHAFLNKQKPVFKGE